MEWITTRQPWITSVYFEPWLGFVEAPLNNIPNGLTKESNKEIQRNPIWFWGKKSSSSSFIYIYIRIYLGLLTYLFVWIPIRHQWPVSHIDLKGLSATKIPMAEVIPTWYRAKCKPYNIIEGDRFLFPHNPIYTTGTHWQPLPIPKTIGSPKLRILPATIGRCCSVPCFEECPGFDRDWSNLSTFDGTFLEDKKFSNL